MSVRYLLDTNICIYIAKHNPPAVRDQFARHTANELAMSVVTLGELRFGAEKSQLRDKAMAVIQQLEALIPPQALPEAAGEHYGQIRALLQREGRTIGNNDLWLAAHARAEGWILVTNNTREFNRVPGLQVENWSENEPHPPTVR
jgi:tRNA(fMet)-specific endonuclease VapC